jgi:alkylhydroperoxidase family enzyme
METTKELEFTLHTEETAPIESAKTFGQIKEQFGFIPNVLRQMAESPTAIQTDLQMLGMYGKSSLTTEEQWIVLLITSSNCYASYCVAANSTIAQMLGVTSDIVEATRTGKTLADPKLEALRLFTTEMVDKRGAVSSQTRDNFYGAGYSKQQALDVILGISVETMASYTAHLAETPVDEQFQKNV